MKYAGPKNLAEKARIENELRRKYPGAYNPDGSAKTGRQVAKDYTKRKKRTKRTKRIGEEVGSGLTKSELDRFR